MGGNYTPLGGKQFNPEAFINLGIIRYRGNGVFVLDNDALAGLVHRAAPQSDRSRLDAYLLCSTSCSSGIVTPPPVQA